MQENDALVLPLIEQAKGGNQLAFETLLIQYAPLIQSKARSFFLLGFDEEDYSQEASLAFFKAVHTYHQQGNFSAYAKACIEHRLQDVVRREKSNKNKVLNESISLENDFQEFSNSHHHLSDFTDAVLNKLSFEQTLSTFFANLSPLEAKVFLYVLGGKNYIEIALLLGKSPKSIDNATQRIKQKLSSFLQERGS